MFTNGDAKPDAFSQETSISCSLQAQGSAHVQSLDKKTLEIVEMKITKSDHAELLFRIVDPDIPDNVLLDRTNGKLQTSKRMVTQDPAVSAHILIDFSSAHDQKKRYPCVVENIDFLSGSLMNSYSNLWMAQSFSQLKKRPAKNDVKTFQPRIAFIAPHSQTIKNALGNGGVLTGGEWVEDRLQEAVFNDPAFQVER